LPTSRVKDSITIQINEHTGKLLLIGLFFIFLLLQPIPAGALSSLTLLFRGEHLVSGEEVRELIH